MYGLLEMVAVMETIVIVMVILVVFTPSQLVLYQSNSYRLGTRKNVHQPWQLLIQAEPILTTKLYVLYLCIIYLDSIMLTRKTLIIYKYYYITFTVVIMKYVIVFFLFCSI